MKRLIISIVILCGIITFSIVNTITLYNVRIEISDYLMNMSENVEKNGAESVIKQTEEFAQLWLKHEEKLMQFIRHSDLEPITCDVARLPYLAKYNDIAELMAEINSIHLQINHLWETQTPRFRTVL